MDITEINAVTFPTVVGAVVFILAQTNYIPRNLLPLVAVIIGAVAGFFTIGIIPGFLAGLASAGGYDLIKKSVVDSAKKINKGK